MHAILTLHETIRTGEITKRRGEGRPIQLTETPSSPWVPEIPTRVRLGTPR